MTKAAQHKADRRDMCSAAADTSIIYTKKAVLAGLPFLCFYSSIYIRFCFWGSAAYAVYPLEADSQRICSAI